jgi:hypothetical protein
MSNSFTSPPTLADEVTVVAGQPIGEGAITAMSESANYLFAYGGTHSVVSQAWAEGQFTQKGTTYQPMVEYKIPIITHEHYDLHIHVIALGPGGIRSTLTIGSSSYTDEVLSTGAGPHLIESTITVTSTPLSSHGQLSIEVKHTTGTPNHHEIRTLAVRWVPKPSPLSTGALPDGKLNIFTPMGINRVGNDYPLSARWGVDMLENIETLRRRPLVYASWSGVDNLSAAPTSPSDPAPPVYLGVGDIEVLFSPVYIPFEAFESGNFYTVTVWIYMVNISATYPERNYVIMGQELSVTANGWSSHDITVRPDSDEQMSELFNFTVYRAGLDNDDNNWADLLTIGSNPTLTPGLPWIQGLCIWGI